MFDVLDPRDTVPDELDQLLLSGHAVPDDILRSVAAARDDGDADALRELLPRLEAKVVLRDDWHYHEPNDVEEILGDMGARPSRSRGELADLRERIHGAWIGRCVGCCMGKPVEGLASHQVKSYLAHADAWPLTTYVPLLEPLPPGIELHPSWPEAVLGRIDGMPRDDDIDYTILALHLVERHGRGFTRADVAAEWLDRLPFTQTYTAERAAYRNVVAGVPVDQAATLRNPYREWIGALIRADLYGYINPGDPASAARMAFADASLSHTQNGLYGAMWVAALIAEAFVSARATDALTASLEWIPRRSRLMEAVRTVISLREGGSSWAEATEWIDVTFQRHSWVHTLNNAAVIAASLLWSEDDAVRAMGSAVQAGYDTDSAAATVGSVMGALLGRSAFPAQLTEPLSDHVHSALAGYDGVKISALAERTHALAVR